MFSQLCRLVLLQSSATRGAGAEERRDGGSVRQIQRRVAAWAVTQNGPGGHSAQQLHLTCAEVGCWDFTGDSGS